jgi:U3 small nucleolar ribonucleoprotein component
MRSGAEVTACAAEGCDTLCPGRTCSASCRSKVWKVENNYRDNRAAQKRSEQRRQAAKKRSQTRYVLIRVSGPIIEVLGFDVGKSKRAVERAFGISDRPDLAAIAERHLPAVV